MKNYYFPGVQVILLDADDIFTMISLHNGNAHNISRSRGADMLCENEHREVDQKETDEILAMNGIQLS